MSQAKPLKLLVHRAEAVKFIQGQIEKGNQLREQKIRSATGLERAREQKLEWTQATTVMLSRIFESDSVIEEYNAWKGKILPEFADLDRFIEHFYDEMDQRIGKLQAIIKRVETEPDVVRRKDLSDAQSHSASRALAQGPAHVAHPHRQSPVTLSSMDQPVPSAAPIVTPRNVHNAGHSHHQSVSAHGHQISHATSHTTPQMRTEPAPVARPTPTPAPISHAPVSHAPAAHAPMSHASHASSSHSSASHSSHSRSEPSRPEPISASSAGPVSRVGVLIIHERDEDVEKALASFIRRLGFELLLINDNTEGIKSAIERIGQQTQIGFAMLLASAEDIAGAQALDQPLSPAARRNAFDMGFCCGKLGPDRVCVLHMSSAGLFHDENGVNYIPIDAAEGWQIQLAKQLRRSGLDVDLNKVLGL
jgi:predicted nucleotide-binding protein